MPTNDFVNGLFTKFINTSTEKSIVLHTDRNIYIAGEKIWFKANVVNSGDGKLDVTPRNLFAEVVNDKDSIIDQLVLNNSGLLTAGAFTLPKSIPTGFYWIRCYTARQLQGDSSGIFVHPVYVLNKQLHDERLFAKQFEKNVAQNKNRNPSVHFFAERLTAIPGIISTGVIEIKDGYGFPLTVTGSLVNSKDSIISSFATNNLGLARLTFVYDSAEKYSAQFYSNERVIRYQLPEANNTAIQLSVANHTAKTIKAFVTLEEGVPAHTHTTLLAVQKNKLYYAAAVTGNYGITIPIDSIPGGIVRLLLYDSNKNLVSERKIYIAKENVGLEIKPDKKTYNAREKVNLHVKLTGPHNKPVLSILTVAVNKEMVARLSNDMDEDMAPPSNTFLLDTWLDKYKTKFSEEDIDLVLVTKKSLLLPSPGIEINRENQEYDDSRKLLNLTGKIINKDGAGIGDQIVTAIAVNTQRFFIDADTTKENGLFTLSVPQGFDSLQLSLQVANKHNVQTRTDIIKIDSFYFPAFVTPLFLKKQFLASNINTLASLQRYHADTAINSRGEGMLATVTIKAPKENLNYDVSRRINSISQILTSDKFRYGGQNALGNAVLMVAGVSLAFGDLSIFGPGSDLSGNIGRPLVIMDGYEVAAKNVLEFLNSLNPADIDFVEVLRGGEAGIYGVRGGNGVISINSKRNSDRRDFSTSNLERITPITYHVYPKFEMPDYSNKEVKNNLNPDMRTTIYWNANITTDANGEADINFYTGDNFSNYTITISGSTAGGDIIYKRVNIANRPVL